MGIPCQNVKQDSLFGVTLKFLRLFFAGLIAIEVQKFLSGRLSRQYFRHPLHASLPNMRRGLKCVWQST